ncbi:MarR family transcriptional regulator [Alicyclobacillus fastidiosus]|uniref:MarR family transcriptional regulator n=1 Tax=Alicyclobacillus fastidiosus TaxID=392011 RepID=A0ABY6ZDW8_9BACL|nr:MarR family transcriptional regulator [Alicyclobacillus fastidiosus]WAH40331.1 MarR family transcriptional regulator [Alicyclobacillus fastidiosus]GMA61714.1 MarR family transcriptional regulator [Alicyclobacillus fastidiosus]
MDYNPLHDSLGFMISQTYRKVANFTMLHFKPYGVTTEQWVVLLTLARHEGITQTQLADLTKKDKTTITRILDSLERKALVERRKDAGDRRAIQAFVTDEGKRLANELADVERNAIDLLFGSYTAQEKEQLKAALLAVQRCVDAQTRASTREPS